MTDSNVSSVTLEWDKAPNDEIDYYFIEIKEKGDTDFKPIGRVDGNSCSYTCDLLEQNVSYLFRIKARNAAGYSQEVSMTSYLRVKNPSSKHNFYRIF